MMRMTFSGCRTFRPGVVSILALAAALGCHSSDELTSVSDPATSPDAAESAQATPAPSFSSSFRGGIPFGVWALPTTEFGGVFNGANRNIDPKHLLRELAAIKARGGRVSVSFSGPERFFKDEDGYFSFSMWKARIDRYKGVDFTSYLEDGTVLGHYIIDEPNDPVNWNNRPVDGPMVEQMAAYSKQLWPKMTTIVRAKPTYMGKWGTIYRHLDVAWAMWWTTQGDPTAYIRREVAEAQRLGLGVITGLNIRKGGPKKSNLDPGILESAGSILLAEEYPCAFISWEYNEAYLSRGDVQAAMTDLSRKAESRPARSCRRQSGGGPPPPPENQAPTARFTPPSCTARASCQFDDASSDDDGEIEAWSWDFGDGETSTDRNPVHTYRDADTYRVTLSVTDDDGSRRNFSSTVNVVGADRAPRPTIDLADCTAGQPCRLTGGTESDGGGEEDDEDNDNEEENEITSWNWSFGDGATATERNPTHTFAAANSYTVILTVTDEDGTTGSISTQLTVLAAPNQGPQAEFAAPSCTQGTPCQFADASTDGDGSIVSRSWSFGGEASSAATNPVHTFDAAGSYTVSLTVEDNVGATGSVSRQVTVTSVAQPENHPFALSGRMLVHRGRHKVRLTWTGAAGSVLDLYRDNRLRERTKNDGLYVRALTGQAGTSFTYRVCERGTTRCSNDVVATIAGKWIGLTATGSVINGRDRARLQWSGVGTASVDVYRNTVRIARTRNDGLYVDNRTRSGGASTAVFQVCEQGTSNCSNTTSVTFP